MLSTATSLCFIGGFRGWEFIVIFLVILLLFGGKKIPELMRGLGKGINSFKQGMAEAKEELNKPLEDLNTAKAESAEPAGKDKA